MQLKAPLAVRGRPWAAAALLCAAGAELAYFPLRRPEYLGFQGTAATSALLIAGALVGCGLHTAARPHRATVSGVAAIVLALLSFPLANLGGFFAGMLLAVAGGALAVGWRTGDTGGRTGPDAPPPVPGGKAAE
ncbi:hypothetical protein SSP35_23_00650 [Streptomyces sp. NBRC 110611]|uniref:DUF6114 domain-containing protein n=1 Tax=Streptomyces sp. NBRC 110611 TaxID=1621259 RepID=UPI00082D5121|nr:DUF6114 domain-containing protein [Streptomyces sp. NBRC 110611]GAU70875.1 hypothetical protein SSP35_23_00650 [Streptomyces sp. NBRC 110611]